MKRLSVLAAVAVLFATSLAAPAARAAALKIGAQTNGGPLASVTFYRIPYDIEQAQQRILSAQLPERLAARLKLGR